MANDVLGDLGIWIVTGHRFLGGFIGDSGDRQNFVMQKVLNWSNHVRAFAAVASLQPQGAYAALTKSLQSEWLFTLRVIPHCGPLFADLEKSLSSCFLPAFLVLRCLPLKDNCFLFLCSLGVLVFLILWLCLIIVMTLLFAPLCCFVNLFWGVLHLSWMHILTLFSLQSVLIDNIS